MRRVFSSRWLIILPAVLFALMPQSAHADIQTGLNAVGYTITEIPPIKSDAAYATCGSEIENNINRNYNGEPFQDCGDDSFMIHMTGFIQIPEHQIIEFWLASDDGGTVKIGLDEFGVWQDQGCSASVSGELDLAAGTQPLDAWFYENGGGTCFMLAWNIDNAGWAIVPDEAFTNEPMAEPTTTTSTTTTTTTTIPPTTTTLPATTTTAQTTTTVAPATTTRPTVPPPPPTQPPPPTTVPEPPTTVPEPPTTIPPSPPTVTTTSSTLPEPPQTTQPPPPTTRPSPPSTQEAPPSTQEASPSTIPTLTTQPAPPIVLTEASQEQVVKAIDQIVTPAALTTAIVALASADAPISAETAVAIIGNDALAELPAQQIEEVFAAIDVAELTQVEATAIVEALTVAPTKVKKAFEKKINVFSGLFNSYKMVGQTIPVGQRRTLVAIGNILVGVGTSLRRKK